MTNAEVWRATSESMAKKYRVVSHKTWYFQVISQSSPKNRTFIHVLHSPYKEDRGWLQLGFWNKWLKHFTVPIKMSARRTTLWNILDWFFFSYYGRPPIWAVSGQGWAGNVIIHHGYHVFPWVVSREGEKKNRSNGWKGILGSVLVIRMQQFKVDHRGSFNCFS